MEILKNYAGWYIHACWSDQVMIGIVMIAVVALIVKYGLMRMSSSWFKIGSPWKIFRKMISLAVLVGVCYGIYLIVSYFWPTLEQRTFKNLSTNLAELELEPEKKKLAAFDEKVKNKEKLTEAEKREAMEADKKISRVRKDYPEGKLIPIQSQQVIAKPEEEVWNWTFKWERNDRQWEEAKKAGRKKKGEEYPARLIEKTPFHLIMEYVSGYSSKPEKVLLKISNTGSFYAKDYFIKNKKPGEIDLALKICLRDDPESPGNFTGTFWQDQDGQQVVCWLSKKQNSLYLK